MKTYLAVLMSPALMVLPAVNTKRVDTRASQSIQVGDILTEIPIPSVSQVSGHVLDVEINSKGGIMPLARQAIDRMNLLKAAGIHVRCTITDKAWSAAFLLLTGCSSRRFHPNATILIHEVKASFPEGNVYTSTMLRQIADDVDAETKVFVTTIATSVEAVLTKETSANWNTLLGIDTPILPDDFLKIVGGNRRWAIIIGKTNSERMEKNP
jgi:hypothetical protein